MVLSAYFPKTYICTWERSCVDECVDVCECFFFFFCSVCLCLLMVLVIHGVSVYGVSCVKAKSLVKMSRVIRLVGFFLFRKNVLYQACFTRLKLPRGSFIYRYVCSSRWAGNVNGRKDFFFSFSFFFFWLKGDF